MSLWRLIFRYKYGLLAGLVLFLGVFSIYTSFGVRLWGTDCRSFEHFDVLFEMDTPRVIDDMTEHSAKHHRTTVHPLYVLFVNPIGSMLNKTQVLGVMQTRYVVAIVLNSFFGATGVLLSFFLFRRMGGDLVNSLLLSLVFAFSMSQFFLSIAPDTASLAIVSLLVTYSLFWISLCRKEVPLTVWVLAGVFALGVTTTNFVQTLICFGVVKLVSVESDLRSFNFRKLKRLLVPLFVFVSGVLLTAAVLAVIQKAVYPSSKLFFLPSSYSKEIGYMTLRVFREPLNIIVQLFKHVFVVNIAGISPRVFSFDKAIPAVTFSGVWNYSGYAFSAFFAWICLVVTGLRTRKYRGHVWFYTGLLGCLAFNLLLHTVYGAGMSGKMEYFLYTGNFTFVVIALFLSPVLGMTNWWVRCLLILLLVSLAVNNLSVVSDIISIYDGA